MNLHQLECAVAVADHRSFTRAAAAMYVAQPTLSYAIAGLEADLGVTLFVRQPRQAVPTPAGDAVLALARRLLALANEVRAVATDFADAVVGDLRIAVHSNAISWVTDRLQTFLQLHPRVVPTIFRLDDGREAVQFVRDGRAEVSIVSLGAVSTDLPTIEIIDNELVCALPAATAPAGDRVSLAELSECGMIAPAPGSAIRDLFDSKFRSAGVSPRIVAQCQDLEWAMELVRAGIGSALTDRTRIGRTRLEGIAVRALDPPLRFGISIVHAPELTSTAAAAFLELVARAVVGSEDGLPD